MKMLDKILDACKYTGTLEPGVKSISASSLDQSDYYLWNRYVFGDVSQPEFDASTLGSVFQLGCDKIFEDDNDYEVATRRKLDLGNGWFLSGEIDLLEHSTSTIYDFKVLSGAGYKNVESSYIINMSVYRALFPEIENYKLFAINKAGSKVKGIIYNIIDVTQFLIEPAEIINQARIKTNKLEEIFDKYSKLGIEPEKDCDVFAFGKDKQGNPNRCEHYCNFKEVCPAYGGSKNTRNHFAFKSLL
jgi:hypothetical protein